MLKIERQKISMVRGDTGVFALNIKDADGNDYDYSDDTVVFTVKTDTSSDTALFQKEVEYGEDVVIEPADTEDLPYGDYVYDVQVTTSDGVVDTVIQPNKFRLLEEVTF